MPSRRLYHYNVTTQCKCKKTCAFLPKTQPFQNQDKKVHKPEKEGFKTVKKWVLEQYN